MTLEELMFDLHREIREQMNDYVGNRSFHGMSVDFYPVKSNIKLSIRDDNQVDIVVVLRGEGVEQ